MVLSDQSAAMPSPRDESHLRKPPKWSTALRPRSLFSRYSKNSIQYAHKYNPPTSCVIFCGSSLEGGGDGPIERLTVVAGLSIVCVYQSLNPDDQRAWAQPAPDVPSLDPTVRVGSEIGEFYLYQLCLPQILTRTPILFLRTTISKKRDEQLSLSRFLTKMNLPSPDIW